ncbi:MAG: DUF4260 domain-containing protein [Candidatus Aenigmatarchaeota archaeon]
MKAESAAIAILSLYGYFGILKGSLLLFAALIMAPDVSMAGYLIDKENGALIYNLFHNYIPPAILLGVGTLTGNGLSQQVALIWTGHISLDRTIGYGLKKPEGFKSTHLN